MEVHFEQGETHDNGAESEKKVKHVAGVFCIAPWDKVPKSCTKHVVFSSNIKPLVVPWPLPSHNLASFSHAFPMHLDVCNFVDVILAVILPPVSSLGPSGSFKSCQLCAGSQNQPQLRVKVSEVMGVPPNHQKWDQFRIETYGFGMFWGYPPISRKLHVI